MPRATTTPASRSVTVSSSGATQSCRARTATSSIGAGANIGFNCEVFSASRVSVGAGTLFAAYTYVVGGDHDFSDPETSVLSQSRHSAGVSIGEGVWTGAGVKILDGTTIGDHAIVGAGAVVRESIPDHAIAAGVPARILGSRKPAPAS